MVPSAAPCRPHLAQHAVACHDAAHFGHLPLSAGACPQRHQHALLLVPPPSTPGTPIAHPIFSGQARYAAGVREVLENYFEGKEIRTPYQIVTNGNLAGAGAHAYSKGNATGGSEDAVGKVKS